MEKQKSYIVNEVDSDEVEKRFENVTKALTSVEKQREKITKQFEKLPVQERIFYLDILISELCISSELPQFYLNGVLEKIRAEARESVPQNMEQISKSTRGYIG